MVFFDFIKKFKLLKIKNKSRYYEISGDCKDVGVSAM